MGAYFATRLIATSVMRILKLLSASLHVSNAFFFNPKIATHSLDHLYSTRFVEMWCSWGCLQVSHRLDPGLTPTQTVDVVYPTSSLNSVVQLESGAGSLSLSGFTVGLHVHKAIGSEENECDSPIHGPSEELKKNKAKKMIATQPLM